MALDHRNSLGTIVKQQRVARGMTLQELAAESGVSAAHLGRIERRERFPSAPTLQRIAKPLGFKENDLLTVAGYLSEQFPTIAQAQQKVNLESIRAIVHELRTLLTPILASSELLFDELRSEPQSLKAQLAQNILNGAHRLEHMLSELLDLTKAEGGLLQVQLEPIAPLAMLQDMASQ